MNPAWSPLTVSWAALAVATFVVLLFRVAPYGRHVTDAWGPTVPHRVGWVVMEIISPLLLITGFAASWSGTLLDLPYSHFVLMGVWIGHYAYRAVAYPFLMRWEGRRMPIIIMLSAVLFNVLNGGLNGYQLAVRPALSMTSPAFLFGAFVFITGLGINIRSDALLRGLRKPGEDGYRIPRGGLFDLVSCPNYLGEILEWVGFAVMAATPAAAGFAVWTAANLVPRALSHHRWYREHFELYPKERKAVVPFIL